MAKRKKSSGDLQQQVHAFLRDSQLEKNAEYASRGRAYRGLSDSELSDKWCAAFTAFADSPSDRDVGRLENDLAAELDLRGLELPLAMVADAWDRFKAQSDAAFSEAKKDPDRFAQIEQDLVDDFAKFKKASERGN
jgi:hypothetical protein